LSGDDLKAPSLAFRESTHYIPDANLEIELGEDGLLYLTGDHTYIVMSPETYRYMWHAAKAEREEAECSEPT